MAVLFCLALAPRMMQPAWAQAGKDVPFTPYADDVRKAIAPRPDDMPRPGLAPNDGETPACRQLRIQIERRRDNPPPMSSDGYPEGPRRDGLPNLSRSRLSNPPADSRRNELEVRYQRECQ